MHSFDIVFYSLSLSICAQVFNPAFRYYGRLIVKTERPDSQTTLASVCSKDKSPISKKFASTLCLNINSELDSFSWENTTDPFAKGFPLIQEKDLFCKDETDFSTCFHNFKSSDCLDHQNDVVVRVNWIYINLPTIGGNQKILDYLSETNSVRQVCSMDSMERMGLWQLFFQMAIAKLHLWAEVVFPSLSAIYIVQDFQRRYRKLFSEVSRWTLVLWRVLVADHWPHERLIFWRHSRVLWY